MSPIKKVLILLIIGVVLVAVSFVPLYAFLPATSYWESRPYVQNGDTQNQNLGYFVIGSYVQLDVFVYGGDNQISVQVLDSGLNHITNAGNIVGSGSLILQVPKNDYYSLYLSNTYHFFSQNDKQMLIKVYYYFYNIIFLVLGILMLVSGVGMILYYELRGSARKVSDKWSSGS